MAKTPAQIKGHPLHPMLIAFPIGLWGFSLVADLVHLALGRSSEWQAVALYTLGGGIATALVAAVPGFIDFLSLLKVPAAKVALFHMATNLGAVLIFSVSFWIRVADGVNSPLLPVGLSALGNAFVVVGGWLGGELVYKHGVAVHEEK